MGNSYNQINKVKDKYSQEIKSKDEEILALKEKLGHMTTIIIAQRVSSIKEADRIVIMKDGIVYINARKGC